MKIMSEDERRSGLTKTLGDSEDIKRVRELIERHEWRFAKTMPGVPHEYSLKWGWPKEDFNYFLNFIWDNGLDAWFSKKANAPKRYWFDHETGWYYFVDPLDFTEDRKASEICKLINRARIELYDFWIEDTMFEKIMRCGVKRR